MRILVCGGRNFDNAQWLRTTLNELYRGVPVSALIEGGAKGADRMARQWAIDENIPVETFEADWHAHGPGAGPLRNKRMLEEGKPDEVVAFPGGLGTANMVKQARRAGIVVHVFEASAASESLRRQT